MKRVNHIIEKSTTAGLRLAVAALILAGAMALWQVVPARSVEASTPVDVNITAPVGAPATFADVIEAVSPAVVNISVSMTHPSMEMGQGGRPGQMPFPPGSPFEDFFRRFFEQQSYRAAQGPVVQGMGSGFIVDPDGYVVTNNHVIEGADEIFVVMNDGTRHEAELKGTDPKTDLALLKVEVEEELPYARFGESDSTRVGDWVIAIGNPFGLGGTATTGIVSARGRDIQSGPFDDFLQIDAPINKGNSGGPLFDTQGRVIGVNTAIYSPNGGSVGIGFAIPSDLAEPIITQLREAGQVQRGWLGVQIQGVTEDIAEGLGREEADGALVASVVPDSPAERAGLKTGDVIVGVNGNEVGRVKDLTRMVAELHPEEKVEIEVWRDGETVHLPVEIGESRDEAAANMGRGSAHKPTGKLGLSLAPLSPEVRQRFQVSDDIEGALIADVEPSSPAAQKGLRPGDVVVMVGQTSVASPAEVVKEVEKAVAQERGSVLLQVARGGQKQFVAVPLA